MEVKNISFRTASAADDGLIAVIWQRAWASANPEVTTLAPISHWRARVDAEFSPPCTKVLILWDEAVVGFYVLQTDIGLLDQLHLVPSHQGLGIGMATMAHIRTRCPQGFLYVSTTNERAIRLYERAGLKPGLQSVSPTTGRPRMAYHWQRPSTHAAPHE